VSKDSSLPRTREWPKKEEKKKEEEEERTPMLRT